MAGAECVLCSFRDLQNGSRFLSALDISQISSTIAEDRPGLVTLG